MIPGSGSKNQWKMALADVARVGNVNMVNVAYGKKCHVRQMSGRPWLGSCDDDIFVAIATL